MKFLADGLLDQLKGVGVVVPDDFAALIIIECYTDALGDSRAAEALSRMREPLREIPAGRALDRVLFGPQRSLRQDAAAVGIHHESLRRLEAQIRECVPAELQCVPVKQL